MSRLLRGGEEIGSPAPALELPAADGPARSLAEFRGRPVMLSFLGPAHCAFCRAHVIKMIQARDAIASSGAEVVLVAHHDPELLMAQMMRDLQLPYLLLVDRTKAAYARWGLGPLSLRSLLVPSLYPALARMILRRERSLGSSPGPAQSGGDFVVDRAGRLVFVNRMRSLHDRAAVEALIEAARAC